MTTLYSGDDLIYIWMIGDNSIGIVNPRNFNHDLIKDFFGHRNEEIMAFTVIASPHEHKLLGLYMKNSDIYFVLARGDNEPVRKLQSSVLGSGKNQN